MGDSGEKAGPTSEQLQDYLHSLENSLVELQYAHAIHDRDRATNAVIVVRIKLASVEYLCDRLQHELDAATSETVRAEAREWIAKVPVHLPGLDRLERWLKRHGPRELR